MRTDMLFTVRKTLGITTTSKRKGAVRALLLSALLVVSVSLSGEGDAQPVPPTSDKLIGTIISKTFTGAVMIDAAGAQSFYRLNDKLPNGLRIVKVRKDGITVMGTDGTPHDLYINHEMKAAASAAPSVSVAPASDAEVHAPKDADTEESPKRRVPRQRYVQKPRTED